MTQIITPKGIPNVEVIKIEPYVECRLNVSGIPLRFCQFSKNLQVPNGIYISVKREFVVEKLAVSGVLHELLSDKLTSDIMIGNLSESRVYELMKIIQREGYDFTQMQFSKSPIFDGGISLPYYEEFALGNINFLLEDEPLITSPDFVTWVQEKYFMKGI